jgi:hypothetical protein
MDRMPREWCDRRRPRYHYDDVRSLAVFALAACGTDVGVQVDAAGPPGSPVVVVASPRFNESFYVTEVAQVQWTATDEDARVRCDARTIGASTISIAGDVEVTSGQALVLAWSLIAVPPGDYRVQVACRDAEGLTGTGTSPMFAVTSPPQQVSFATQVEPLLGATCTSMQCHDNVMPQGGLTLTAGNAYAAIVGVASTQCSATLLVKPGAPSESYLVHKLQGSGACFMGTRMPKPPATLSTPQIQLVRDWIANGAPSN